MPDYLNHFCCNFDLPKCPIKQVKTYLEKFIKFATECNIPIKSDDICIKVLCSPHDIPEWEKGRIAVYMFFHGNKCLKIGKIGPKSKARYTTQHYDPNGAKSCLAKSLQNEGYGICSSMDQVTLKDWIRQNTCRVNLLICAKKGIAILSLIESYLICVLNPEFEGFKSQKN